MTGFVHLRVHTEYSLVDSVVRVDPLVETLDKLGMPACAITDQGNVSAMYMVAVAHASGYGAPQDPAEAAKWFRRAAEAGDAEAQRRREEIGNERSGS